MEWLPYLSDFLLAAIYVSVGVGGYLVKNQQTQINKKVDKDLLDVELKSLSKEIGYIKDNLIEVKDDVKYLRRNGKTH